MASSEVMLDTVVPALGALMSTLMYAAPVKAVLKASRDRALGDLNPIPFAVTIANCVLWLAYGLLKRDPFVTAPNATGVAIGAFTTLTAFGLADDKTKQKLKSIMVATAAILPAMGVYTSFFAGTKEAQQGLWGKGGNIVALIYYAAPLSSMAEVVRTRNSASILLPMTTMNTLNASLWTIYGFAVLDPYIWVPNAIGLALSCAQIVLKLLFPSGPGSGAKYSKIDDDPDRHHHQVLMAGGTAGQST